MKIKTLNNGNDVDIFEDGNAGSVFGEKPCEHAKNIETYPANNETHWILPRILCFRYDSNSAQECVCFDCLLKEIKDETKN
jgi:hypothetical protein